MLKFKSLLDIKISLSNLDDGFDHDFARIDEVRLLERLVLFETFGDNDGELGASQNNLRTLLLFLEVLEKDDEIINNLLALVSCLDSVNDALEKVLVFLVWRDWLDSSSQKRFLEQAGFNTADSSENTASLRRVGGKNVFQNLVGSDLDHAHKRNITAALNNVLFEGMCSVACTDNEIGIGSNQVFRHQL